MRTVFEEEEEIAPTGHPQDRELTISSTTLLAIFFGLVLICGLFFGLGYTLGRRSSSEATQLPSAASTIASSNSQPAVGSQPKPAAASQPNVSPTPDTDTADQPASDETLNTSTGPAQSNTQPNAQAAAPTAAPAAAPQPLRPTGPIATQPASIPANPPAPGPSPGLVVQIAAISNPADADVLVSALQKRGYSVSARRFPGDPLVHVQVGPFTNRADAVAMRQKLLGDGYNAILKP